MDDACALPDNFYKKESSKRFVNTMHDNHFSVQRFDGDLVRIYEEKDLKDNRLIGKYEAVFINPVDGNFHIIIFIKLIRIIRKKMEKYIQLTTKLGRWKLALLNAVLKFIIMKDR